MLRYRRTRYSRRPLPNRKQPDRGATTLSESGAQGM